MGAYHSLTTALGHLSYWERRPTEADRGEEDAPIDRLPLVFCHGLGVGSSAFEWSRVYSALGSGAGASDTGVPDTGVPGAGGSDADGTDTEGVDAVGVAPHLLAPHLIVPEFIGWGRSDKPDRRYQVQDYLDQLEQVLVEVARSPAWVIAASLTGGLALMLACQKPHLFRGLALVSPSGYGDFGQTYRNPFLAGLAPWGLDRSLYPWLTQSWTIALAIDRFLLSPHTPLSMPERQAIHRAYRTAAQRPHAQIAALATLRGDLCFDLAAWVPRLQVPTHLLWGQQARASAVTLGPRLQALNPDQIRTVTVVPNAGMVPHLEHPQRVRTWLWQRLTLTPHGGDPG